jgi:hypothetical protein
MVPIMNCRQSRLPVKPLNQLIIPPFACLDPDAQRTVHRDLVWFARVLTRLECTRRQINRSHQLCQETSQLLHRVKGA